MFDWIFSTAGWLQFATLLLLEIILGIDNIIFLSIVTNALPAALRARARFIGLALALLARLGFLAAVFWLSKLTAPLFALAGHAFSGRDLVLLLGGGFLVVKSSLELRKMIIEAAESAAESSAASPDACENPAHAEELAASPDACENQPPAEDLATAKSASPAPADSAGSPDDCGFAHQTEDLSAAKSDKSAKSAKSRGFFFVLLEIIFIDLIFSIDSVITAVGIADQLGIMMAAVVGAVVFMMIASAPVSALIERFVQLKILALAFLVLIGGVLCAEGLGAHIDRAYIYAALGFSLITAALQIAYERARDGS